MHSSSSCHTNPLKNIFRQLDDLLIWGHYMQAIDKSYYPDYSEIALAMEAVITALKAQRSDALPDAFSNAFALIYQDVCMVLLKLLRFHLLIR